VNAVIKKGDSGRSEQKRLRQLYVFGETASAASMRKMKGGTGGTGELRREQKYREIGRPGMVMVIRIRIEINQENLADQGVGIKTGLQS
jgi:hypothetical protein